MNDASFSLPLTPPPPSFDGHLPQFAEGRHRLVGAVATPERLFPGAPTAGDGPPRPGQPGPPPTPRPGPQGPPPPGIVSAAPPYGPPQPINLSDVLALRRPWPSTS